MAPHSKRRIPKLAFTKTQDIGWHVNYCDPVTGVPRRRRFGLIEQDVASTLYTAWLGHAASSAVADVYMRPVSPEHREVVEYVRKHLTTAR